MASPAPPGSTPPQPPAAPPAGHLGPGWPPAPPPGPPPPGWAPGAPPGAYPPGWAPGTPWPPPRPPSGGGGAVAIVVVVAVVSAVMVIGILAAIAIPSFIRYKQRAQTSEATFSLSRIVHGATAYFDDAASPGEPAGARRFPASVDWTPAQPPCAGGVPRYAPDPQAWAQPTWQALRFELADPHRFRYRFTSRGAGDAAAFTVEAEADLGCNGRRTTYRREGRVAAGRVVSDPAASGDSLD